MNSINLIRYNRQKGGHELFIDRFGYTDYLSVLGNLECGIEVSQFFGSDLERDFSNQDALELNTISKLKSFLETKQDLVLNKLEFTDQNGLQNEFTDNNNALLSSDKDIFFSKTVIKITSLLGLDSTEVEKLRNNEGQYLLFVDSKLVEVFDTFDQYLTSRWSNVDGSAGFSNSM